MKVSLLGKKLGMTRLFTDDGRAIAVTVIEMEPSVVSQVKTTEKDGYDAIQLGYGKIKEKKVKKAQRGLFNKAKIPFKNTLYEIPLSQTAAVEQGDLIGIENFEAGDVIDVTGTSIGKGFQGVMKRHHFSGGRGSHGDKTGRRSGSIGQSAYPSRTFKNMRGPGQMGNKMVTTQNLEVVKVDTENNLLIVEGSVPGAKNSLVRISLSLKKGKDKELVVVKGQEEKKPETSQPDQAEEQATQVKTQTGETSQAEEPKDAKAEESDDAGEETKQEDK
jgi:large subunit ribosomal protein L3